MSKQLIAITCRKCDKTLELEVDAAAYDRWRLGGEIIQIALPELTNDQRELLISQTCGVCFDRLFAEDDYEEDEDAPAF